MIEGQATYGVLTEILSRHPEWEQAQIPGLLFPHPAAAPDERRPPRCRVEGLAVASSGSQSKGKGPSPRETLQSSRAQCPPTG
ncbi:hypothetical protein GCM10023080_002510 [Streptomyces pseudoechinosporeus]